MRDLAGKRYWLIGASEGLGRALAIALAQKGARVVLSARSQGALQAVASEIPGRAEVVPFDVTDSSAVVEAASAVGPIDGLIYLAAVYWPMSATDWQADKAEAMVEVNLLGAVRVLGQVVPGMVARGAGHVVLTGSLAGYRGLGGAVGYGASKAGIMHLAEGMRADLRGTGVDVQLVNPGFIRTRLTAKNDFSMPFIMDPDEAAARIVAHMRGNRFATAFPRAFGMMFRLSRFLPDWLYYRLA